MHYNSINSSHLAEETVHSLHYSGIFPTICNYIYYKQKTQPDQAALQNAFIIFKAISKHNYELIN